MPLAGKAIERTSKRRFTSPFFGINSPSNRLTAIHGIRSLANGATLGLAVHDLSQPSPFVQSRHPLSLSRPIPLSPAIAYPLLSHPCFAPNLSVTSAKRAAGSLSIKASNPMFSETRCFSVSQLPRRRGTSACVTSTSIYVLLRIIW